MPHFKNEDELHNMNKQDLIKLVLGHQHTMEENSWVIYLADDNVYCSECGNLGSLAGDSHIYQCPLCDLKGCNNDYECQSRFESEMLSSWTINNDYPDIYSDLCKQCSNLLLQGLTATYNTHIIKNILSLYFE